MERRFLSITFFLIMVYLANSHSYVLKSANWNWLNQTPKIVQIWINPNCQDDPSAFPPSTQRQAIQNAMNTWTGVETNFAFEYATSSNVTDYTENDQNDFFWFDGQHPEDPAILAETWPWDPYPPVTEFDVAFFDNHVWSTGSTPGANQYDVESVALHELGHVLGLADVDPPSSAVMLKEIVDPQQVKRILDDDDIDGMKAIYGLVVTNPNGSDIWYIGTSYNVTWGHDGVSGNVNIVLNRNYPDENGWTKIFSDTPNDGIQPWTPTVPPSDNSRIRLESVDNYSLVYDVSDADFTIAGYTVTYPTYPGIHWFLGQERTITWTSVGNPGNVNIEINRSYPSANWETLVYNIPDNGSYTWTVAGVTSTTCRIKVRSVSSADNCAISKHNFEIVLP
jgi:hypothetical protein